MATSGTYDWNIDSATIIDEAYERAGLELFTGYDLEKGVNSLNLLLTDWTNDNVSMWLLEEVQFNTVEGQAEYKVDSSLVGDNATVAIMQIVINRALNDYPCTRISYQEYQNLTTKQQKGRPVQFAVKREFDVPKIVLWPTAENDTDAVKIWRLRYPQDVTFTFTQNPEIPRRFLPALVSGLGYYVARRNPSKVDPALRAILKSEYMEDYNKAKDEDRDRASIIIRPQAKWPR